MKVTAFFVLLLGLIFLIGAVSGYFYPQAPWMMWLGGLIALYLMVSSYFLVKKRMAWAWADLIVVLVMDLYFLFLWAATKAPFPYALMSLPSLFVTVVLCGSLLNALKNGR